jgi:hypothetical protein
VHACHGRARQVEVLRDAILHRLREDPTLELRDVIVMCPDIETFAPLIQATFAAATDDEEDDLDDVRRDPGGLPVLRVRLADRALRQTNPVLGVIARLLELATARVTASDLLDLADRAPVRRRFGSTTTRSRAWRPGPPTRACAGGWTPRAASRSAWAASTTARGAPACSGAPRGGDDRGRRAPGRRGAAARRRAGRRRRPGRARGRARRPGDAPAARLRHPAPAEAWAA